MVCKFIGTLGADEHDRNLFSECTTWKEEKGIVFNL